MPSPKNPKKSKAGTPTKGVSLTQELIDLVDAQAEREDRSFSFIVRRAIERDLKENRVTADSPESVSDSDDTIDTEEVARRLRVSKWTVLRRARKKNDPLRLAVSRVGKQKPKHFVLSRILAMEREAAAA